MTNNAIEIARDTHFARCWPNSETTERFDFIHLVPDGNRAFVTYEGRGAKGHRFRNDDSRKSSTPEKNG